eukprot:3842652-Pyramimonas_sp.AAC.1
MCRPPSGGTLFASVKCPRQHTPPRVTLGAFIFNCNAYPATCEMNKRAFRKAYPSAEHPGAGPLRRGGSPRKTMAQLLWAAVGMSHSMRGSSWWTTTSG